MNAADIRVFVSSPAGGNPANGNHIGIAGKTGIADIDIVAGDFWVGTGSSAQCSIELASAILKRGVTHCSVCAAVNVVLQRERAHSRVGGTVVIINQGGCSQSTVFYARGVEQKRCGTHCRIGIGIVGNQRSGANAGVEIGGASSKQRIPTKSCISSPAGEMTERVAPFRRREIRVASVRWRSERLHLWQKRKAAEH